MFSTSEKPSSASTNQENQDSWFKECLFVLALLFSAWMASMSLLVTLGSVVLVMTAPLTKILCSGSTAYSRLFVFVFHQGIRTSGSVNSPPLLATMATDCSEQPIMPRSVMFSSWLIWS